MYRLYKIFKGLQDAISKNFIVTDKSVLSARVLAKNATAGSLVNCAWWQRQGLDIGGPRKLDDIGMEIGNRPNTDYPVRKMFLLISSLSSNVIPDCKLNECK
ncbi:hypothetical protein JTB14_021844 [Gonioctena quinquepunctata]|nr:hypothetical protein JTB14_021844 [Gonioctena quinquepunctata]